jgi:hypothetical protein
MTADPHLVLFCGGMTGTAVEDALGDALRESALDTLDEALSTGAYDGATLVVDAATAAAFEQRLPANVRLDVDQPGAAFHFGKRLAGVVQRYALERPVYIGCGLPLIKGDELASVASVLAAGENAVVSNNFFSADLVGFVPGSVVKDLDLPDNDRILPRLLVQQAGLVNQSLPRTISNQFDIDTPGDLAVLAYTGGAGPRLTAYIERTRPRTDHLAKAAWLFTDREAEVLVSGRVGSQVWAYLETETACRIRMYSEERGMQAAGRDLSGEAKSILAYHLQAVGPERFFQEIAEMVQAAFIDTRVIFTQLGLDPSRPDRFASDDLAPELVSDPWIRDFTAAARDASIPVVLGGSSLVTSGVQLLSEAAWREHDKVEAEYRARGRAAPPR